MTHVRAPLHHIVVTCMLIATRATHATREPYVRAPLHHIVVTCMLIATRATHDTREPHMRAPLHHLVVMCTLIATRDTREPLTHEGSPPPYSSLPHMSCTWHTCMRTAPLHLPKKVTEKPSVNHIGSSTSHQQESVCCRYRDVSNLYFQVGDGYVTLKTDQLPHAWSRETTPASDGRNRRDGRDGREGWNGRPPSAEHRRRSPESRSSPQGQMSRSSNPTPSQDKRFNSPDFKLPPTGQSINMTGAPPVGGYVNGDTGPCSSRGNKGGKSVRISEYQKWVSVESGWSGLPYKTLEQIWKITK